MTFTELGISAWLLSGVIGAVWWLLDSRKEGYHTKSLILPALVYVVTGPIALWVAAATRRGR